MSIKKKIAAWVGIALGIIAVLAALNFLGLSQALAAGLPDKPSSYVVDTADMFNSKDKELLEKQCKALHESGKAEFYIVTVPDTGDQELADFNSDLGDKWKVGKKDVDNGIILTIARDTHKMRMDVGRGLEEQLTDAECGKILDDMGPFFKDGKFYAGVQNAVTEVENKVDASDLTPTANEQKDASLSPFWKCFWIGLGIVFVLWLLSKMFGGKGGSGGSGSGSGSSGFFFLGGGDSFGSSGSSSFGGDFGGCFDGGGCDGGW